VDFSEEFHPAAFFSFSSSLNSSTVANLSEKFHRSMLSASRVTAHISIPHLNLFFFFFFFLQSDSEYGNIYMVQKQLHGNREVPLDGLDSWV
jgi:hypothetical protein